MKVKVREINFQKKTLEKLEHVQKILDSYDMAITVRQIHYRLVAMDVIQNTFEEYRAVSRIVTDGRYAGILDWDKITDDTRGAYKTTSWDSIKEAIETQVERFRYDRWKDSEYYVEVWTEKRGLVNLLYSATNNYDVNLVTCGGFDSASEIWEAVKRLYDHEDKKIRILYFGDCDPSGDFMSEDVDSRISEFGLDFHVERILLNDADIEKYSLPKKFEVKAKKNQREYDKLQADPRARRFKEKYGELFQVEIDAMEPNAIIEHVQKSIERYLDKASYEEIITAENEAKDEMRRNIENGSG